MSGVTLHTSGCVIGMSHYIDYTLIPSRSRGLFSLLISIMIPNISEKYILSAHIVGVYFSGPEKIVTVR